MSSGATMHATTAATAMALGGGGGGGDTATNGNSDPTAAVPTTTTTVTTTATATATAAGPTLKHKRRYCKAPGCSRIVKSQGLCQRHGAKPRQCKVVGCPKQAQGNFDGMCKKHFKDYKKTTTPLPTVPNNANPLQPPEPVGESVYDAILPASLAWTMQSAQQAAAAAATVSSTSTETTPVVRPLMPLVAHLKAGFDANKPSAWHRNEERAARGLWPVSSAATQLENWERSLVFTELLLLSGNPDATFRHLARGWGRDKGFHMVLAQYICERRGDVERKKKSDTSASGSGGSGKSGRGSGGGKRRRSTKTSSNSKKKSRRSSTVTADTATGKKQPPGGTTTAPTDGDVEDNNHTDHTDGAGEGTETSEYPDVWDHDFFESGAGVGNNEQLAAGLLDFVEHQNSQQHAAAAAAAGGSSSSRSTSMSSSSSSGAASALVLHQEVLHETSHHDDDEDDDEAEAAVDTVPPPIPPPQPVQPYASVPDSVVAVAGDGDVTDPAVAVAVTVTLPDSTAPEQQQAMERFASASSCFERLQGEIEEDDGEEDDNEDGTGVV